MKKVCWTFKINETLWQDTLEITRNLYGCRIPIEQALIGIDIYISEGTFLKIFFVLLVKSQMSIRGVSTGGKVNGQVVSQ